MPRFGGHTAANGKLGEAKSGDAKTQGNCRRANVGTVPSDADGREKLRRAEKRSRDAKVRIGRYRCSKLGLTVARWTLICSMPSDVAICHLRSTKRPSDRKNQGLWKRRCDGRALTVQSCSLPGTSSISLKVRLSGCSRTRCLVLRTPYNMRKHSVTRHPPRTAQLDVLPGTPQSKANVRRDILDMCRRRFDVNCNWATSCCAALVRAEI